jgi:hypothetical protein
MHRACFDELVHRVNNLLGTIQVQAEVARSLGDLPAHQEALRLIEASAERTKAEVRSLQARIQGTAGA